MKMNTRVALMTTLFQLYIFKQKLNNAQNINVIINIYFVALFIVFYI